MCQRSKELKDTEGIDSGKKPACTAGDVRDSGSIRGLGRSPGERNGNPEMVSSILTWRIPWTKEPGELQSMGSQRAGHD